MPEGLLAFNRARELILRPVKGHYDRAHLLEIHRRLFHGIPGLKAGRLRSAARAHDKHRKLKVADFDYPVIYAHRRLVDRELDPTLATLGLCALEGWRTVTELAPKLSALYAALDHLHPFADGNSRTLREFTRQMAQQVGYRLDWQIHHRDEASRERLYIARDREVLERSVGHYSVDEAREAAERHFNVRQAWSRLQLFRETTPSLRLINLITEALDSGQAKLITALTAYNGQDPNIAAEQHPELQAAFAGLHEWEITYGAASGPTQSLKGRLTNSLADGQALTAQVVAEIQADTLPKHLSGNRLGPRP